MIDPKPFSTSPHVEKLTFGKDSTKWFLRFLSGNVPFRWKTKDKQSGIEVLVYKNCLLCHTKWNDYQDILRHILLHCSKISRDEEDILFSKNFGKMQDIFIQYIQKCKNHGFKY